MANDTHRGTCFCGAVEITVEGAPVGMGFCHCASCRQWSAGPVNAFTLWKPEAVKVTKGADQLASYMKQEPGTSLRKWCKVCGGHVLTEHGKWGVTDVYAAIIPSFEFKPGVHVNYAEKVVAIKDGLPKMKDFPAEMGGSGVTLPE